MSTEDDVREPAERKAIEAVILKYCHGVDLQNFDAMVQEALAANRTHHHGERTVQGSEAIHDRFVREGTANLAATAHAITNVMIDWEGSDEAKMDSLVTSWVWTRENADKASMRPADHAMSVRYDDELTRDPEGWRIDRRVVRANGVSLVAVGEIPKTQTHAFTLSVEA